MRKFNKINEAEAQVAEAPVEVQAGKKPTEGHREKMRVNMQKRNKEARESKKEIIKNLKLQ